MPRVVSFIVLLAVIVLIGSMFFQVMVQFIVPLFLAAVLVVIFKPLHMWVLSRMDSKPRLAAAVTTCLIVLIVLVPLGAIGLKAFTEVAQQYYEFNEDHVAGAPAVLPDDDASEGSVDSPEDATLGSVTVDRNALLAATEAIIPSINGWLKKVGMSQLEPEQVSKDIGERFQSMAGPVVVGGVQALASTLFSLAIMVLTLYYFFADGPSMVVALMKLSPLDDAYEQELLDKFASVSRSVVVAVLLSAIAQGALAGMGYFFAGVTNVFLCTVITTIFAMVPFVGATVVWIPICLVLYFSFGYTTAAIVLAIYCTTVVSMVDNLIKPLVLHGQANLHPLLALLSVIGGIQALGPIGILVGPMLVAFLQALLNMLNKELELLGQESDEHGTPVVFATGAVSPATDPQAGLPLPADVKAGSSKQRKRNRKKK